MQTLAVLVLAAQAAAAPAHSTDLRGEDLMKALQSGGYTIVLRHARTDWSFKEEIGTVPVDRSAQRNLSADGVRGAALMGVVLRRYRIPIGEIVASPMFRARETAEYAAGTPTISMALRVFPTTDETAAIVAAVPKPGTNRLLVTHHFVIETLVPGIKPGDVAESEAAVVRPTGDGHVALVGRITLGDWEQLAGVPSVPKAVTSAGPVTVPDTPAGQLAPQYIEAYNSGDSAKARAFIETSLSDCDNSLPRLPISTSWTSAATDVASWSSCTDRDRTSSFSTSACRSSIASRRSQPSRHTHRAWRTSGWRGRVVR